jgi:hypothetical protein
MCVLDYRKKEYTLHFMLLFTSFRTSEDFEKDGCYQNVFQISVQMILIAENIQIIHNCLASGIPENSLSAKTSLVELGDLERINNEKDKTMMIF